MTRGTVDLEAYLRRHRANPRIVAGLARQGVTPDTARGVQAKAKAKPGEATMALLAEHLTQACIPFEREHRFAPPRRWRLDFWLAHARLAVEIDGGVHAIRKQFKSDVEKHRAIARLGLTLYRFTPEEVRDRTAIHTIRIFPGVLHDQ